MSYLKRNSLGKKVSDYPEYWVFKNMQQRCDNPKHIAYKWYGANGISYCERWISFKNFLEDMGERPSKKHTLERIDNNKNYSPDNCKWALMSEQCHNRRKRITNTSGYTGVNFDKTSGKWVARLQIKNKRIHIGLFKDPKKAYEAYLQKKSEYGLLS